MKDDPIFDFNYPLLSSDQIAHEVKIKQALRDSSYNEIEAREITRYSDRYICVPSHDAIEKLIDIELLSPELIKLYGAFISKDVAVVQADVDEQSAENNEEDAENESLAGGDDYSGYYNDEDELVGENEGTDANDGATY
ncbi:hypothetical protein PAEPH01_0059 [Pancytospora epiphaga]|nr:hypothetical protein PAEPH01_0059 [Pancytospora epiphaga]